MCQLQLNYTEVEKGRDTPNERLVVVVGAGGGSRGGGWKKQKMPPTLGGR